MPNKSPSHPRTKSLHVPLLLTSCAINLHAATLYWDGLSNMTLGESDNTNTAAQGWLSDGLWDDGSTSQSLASWTAGDSAVFGGSAASQTITAGTFTIGDLTFGGGADASGTSGTAYTLTGGDLTLSSTTITTNTDTVIESVLSGTSSLAKAGDGTLTLSGDTTFSGGGTISHGSLALTGSNSGTGVWTIGNGGTLDLTDGTGLFKGLGFFGNPGTSYVTVNSGGTLITDQFNYGVNSNLNTLRNNYYAVTLNGGTLRMLDQTFVRAFTVGASGATIEVPEGETVIKTAGTTASENIIRFSAASTLTFTGGGDFELGDSLGAYGDTGFSIAKTGSGTLTMTGSNNYSGSTIASGGRLVISGLMRNANSPGMTASNGATIELGTTNMFVAGHGAAVADGMVLTADGGTLLMNTNMESRIGNVTLANGGTFTSNRGLGAWDVLLANTTAGPATVSVTGSGAATMNGSGGIHLQGIQNFAVADTTGNADPDLTVSMILANNGNAGGDPGGINKTGDGLMQLTADNTFQGNITIEAGTLEIGGSGRLGKGSYAGNITNNSELLFSTSQSQTLSGEISGTGSITSTSTGGLLMTGTSTYSGVTNIGGSGYLEVNGGPLSIANSVLNLTTDNSTRGLDIWAGKLTVRGITGTGIIVSNGSQSNQSWWNTDPVGLSINVPDGENYNFGGPLRNQTWNTTAELTVEKTGDGTQVLSGNSSYSGGTIINGGVLRLGTNTNPLGSGGVTVNDGGTLDLNGYPAASNAGYGLGVTIAGTGSAGQGALTNSGGNTNNGMIQFPSVTLSANASIGGTGDFYMIASGYGASTLNLAGHTLTKTGSNTYFLTNTTVDASGGTIQIDQGSIGLFNLNSNASAAAVSLANTAGVSLNLAGNNLSVGSLAGGGTTGGNVTLGGGTLTLGALGTDTTFDGGISGSGGLVKTGTGTQTLAGTNSYTGTTTVNAGSLIVDGDMSAATGDVTIASGATLGGSGTLGGATTNSGTLAPGNSPGILNFDNGLTLTSTSIFEWELFSNTDDLAKLGSATDGYDGVDVTGNASVGGTFRVLLGGSADFDSTFWQSDRTWENVFVVSGTTSGSFSSFELWDNGAGSAVPDLASHGSFSFNSVNGSLEWSAIPEPASALVGLLLSAGLLHRRRGPGCCAAPTNGAI